MRGSPRIMLPPVPGVRSGRPRGRSSAAAARSRPQRPRRSRSCGRPEPGRPGRPGGRRCDPASNRSVPDLLREAEVGGVVAVQVTDLAAADRERELAPPAGPPSTPGHEVTSSVIRSLAVWVSVMVPPRARLFESSLQVQVNLKSRAERAFLAVMPTDDDRRGRPAQRGSGLGLRFYEQRGLITLRAGGLRPSPLSEAGAAPDRLHRLRSTNRVDAR